MRTHAPQFQASPENPIHVPESGLVERIVIPVGGSDREFSVQQQAVEYAAALGAPLVAVHVTPTPDTVSLDLFGYLEGLCRRWGVVLQEQVIPEADVQEAVLSVLDPQDLLIMGTARLDRAQALLRAAPCPVQFMPLDA